MEKAYKEGKVRAIGLSNFNMEQMQEILNICEVKPAILQTEVHPYSQEPELKKFLEKEGMVIQAWYPLGHGDKALIQEPLFTRLAEKYQKNNVQIILRWHIQAGDIVVVRGHVGIAAGGGTVIDASSSNGRVVHRSLSQWWANNFICAWRIF